MAEAAVGLELPIGVTDQKAVQSVVRMVARIEQEAKKAERAAVTANEGITRSFTKMSNQSRAQIQNVSYQLQDVFVQIAGGQGATRALSQQMPQLLGGFGALGAVLGTVAAVAIPLVGSFLGTADAAKELEESIESLEKAVRAYQDAAADSEVSAIALMEKFGAASSQAADLHDRIARFKYLDAVDAVGNSITSLSKNFGELQTYLNIVNSEMDRFGTDRSGTAQDAIRTIKEEFGLTVEQAREFVNLLSDAQAAQSVQEKATLLNRIAIYLDDAVRSSADADANLRSLAMAASQGALESYELAKSAESLSLSNREAAEAASMIAANVAGIDFSGPIAGASALVAALTNAMAAVAALEGRQAQAVKRAQIARDYAGDNVGKAGALGAVDFNATYDAANPYQGPLTKEMLADINSRREVYVEGEKELARIQEDTQNRLKAISNAGKGGGGKKKGGGAGKAKKDEPSLFESAQDQIKNLEREITLLGKSSEEVARAKAEWAMLDEAKRRGVPVNDQLSAQIQSQAEQVGRLTSELEAAKLAQDEFDQAVEGIATAFSNAILEGENLRESLANIFKQIAANILNAGIQNALKTAFSGAGQGGGFWGLLAGAFGGTKAAAPSFDGGGFTGLGSRSGGIDGKGGFPAILHPNETVLDHSRGQGASGSRSVAMTIDLRGTTGDRALDDKIAAAGRSILAQVPAAMDSHNKRRG